MVVLRANTIKQIKANETASDFTKWCNNKSDCLYKSKKRKFHGWINLDNLTKKDQKAQCGWDNGDCNHTTKHGIGGYSNVCPIAGFNGDRPWPAKLQFSNFKFSKNGITSSAKIKSVTVSFQHRMIAIDTGTGKTYDNFGPTFHSDNNSWAVKIYFTNGSDTVSSIKKHNDSPKLSKTKYSTVTYEFTDITIDELLNNNFALNIEYNHNYNTNPGIIYIKNVQIDVKYSNATKYITATNDVNSLYAGTDSHCRSFIIQTVEAGYKKGDKKIPLNEAPAKLGSKIQVITKPDNVTVTQQTQNDLKKTFKVIDSSGIAGTKSITYGLNDDTSKKVTIKYEAYNKKRPDVYVEGEYKYQEDFDSNKAYIIADNGCTNKIFIYIDSIVTSVSNPIELSISNNNENNLLNTDAQRTFHNAVKSLSCGFHALYIRRGDESIEEALNNKCIIKISPMEYAFKIYSDTNPSLSFVQTKIENDRYETINIKRIDNEPRATIPFIAVQDDTQKTDNVTEYTNVGKGDVITYTIDKYHAGKFKISVIETKNTCVSSQPSERIISIEPSHKQNYDYLFTRGESGTAFDFDYLVAWEGDNIATPLYIAGANDITLHNTENTIKLCSKNMQSSLSQIGAIPLRVINMQDIAIKNIQIEVNVLTKNNNGIFDASPNEWVSNNGIFSQFYNLFKEYNEMNNNVEIQNLTQDNDLIDEENVYLLIKNINPSDSVMVYLPFRSFAKKEIKVEYLLFEEPQDIYDIDSNCNVKLPDKYITINVSDSILTQIEIEGETDLRNRDTTYQCPMECYTTAINGDPQSGGIKYKITNIDTMQADGLVKTRIKNSPELQPYGYFLNNHFYNLFDNNGNRIAVNEGIPELDYNGNIMKDENNQIIYAPNRVTGVCTTQTYLQKMVGHLITAHIRFPHIEEQINIQRTNNNGIAVFYITLPQSIGQGYTVNELLNGYIYFEFKETERLNGFVLSNDTSLLISSTSKNKDNTLLSIDNDYRRYQPGDIIRIPVKLSSYNTIVENYIDFNADIKDNGSSDEVIIMYRICNIENNEGIFKTVFETNDTQLVPNKVSKEIYCGITTDIELDTRIEKQLLESQALNVIYIDLTNGIKNNKDVKVTANLGPIENYNGDYSFIDIDIDDGDYAITTETVSSQTNIIVTWLIGEMSSYEKRKGSIKIKAENVGLSDIQVGVFDYIHQPTGVLPVKQNQCPRCQEKQSYKLKDSPYKKFDGIWYKKIDGVYKKRIKYNNDYIWVNKDE